MVYCLIRRILGGVVSGRLKREYAKNVHTGLDPRSIRTGGGKKL